MNIVLTTTLFLCLSMFQIHLGLGQQCSNMSPYVFGVGVGLDGSKLSLAGASLEAQYFTNVPMMRTPGDCWYNPFTNTSDRLWLETSNPIPMPQFDNVTSMFEFLTTDDFDMAVSAHFGANFLFGLLKGSADWNEFIQIAVTAGASRMTSQGQFSSFRVDAISRQASAELITVVSNLCKKWYFPGCWNSWETIFSDPVAGFGTHYVASTAMGGGWNYKKFSTYLQLVAHGYASLQMEASLNFLFLIRASGCVCGSAYAAADWFVGAGTLKTDCYGGTQPELCSQDSSTAWTQWIDSIPYAPMSLVYAESGAVFPKFEPIWTLFNDSYQDLSDSYKDASTAYVIWEGVKSAINIFELIMKLLHDLIDTQCVSSTMDVVKTNAASLLIPTNETYNYMVESLLQRDVVGYQVDKVAPYLTNWTSSINTLTHNLFQNLTSVACTGTSPVMVPVMLT